MQTGMKPPGMKTSGMQSGWHTGSYKMELRPPGPPGVQKQ